MSDTRLISGLLTLSTKRRAKIAGILLRSLDAEDNVDQGEVDQAWAKEITSRLDDIRSGKVKTVSSDVFLKKLRANVKRVRRAK